MWLLRRWGWTGSSPSGPLTQFPIPDIPVTALSQTGSCGLPVILPTAGASGQHHHYSGTKEQDQSPGVSSLPDPLRPRLVSRGPFVCPAVPDLVGWQLSVPQQAYTFPTPGDIHFAFPPLLFWDMGRPLNKWGQWTLSFPWGQTWPGKLLQPSREVLSPNWRRAASSVDANPRQVTCPLQVSASLSNKWGSCSSPGLKVHTKHL